MSKCCRGRILVEEGPPATRYDDQVGTGRTVCRVSSKSSTPLWILKGNLNERCAPSQNPVCPAYGLVDNLVTTTVFDSAELTGAVPNRLFSKLIDRNDCIWARQVRIGPPMLLSAMPMWSTQGKQHKASGRCPLNPLLSTRNKEL